MWAFVSLVKLDTHYFTGVTWWDWKPDTHDTIRLCVGFGELAILFNKICMFKGISKLLPGRSLETRRMLKGGDLCNKVDSLLWLREANIITGRLSTAEDNLSFRSQPLGGISYEMSQKDRQHWQRNVFGEIYSHLVRISAMSHWLILEVLYGGNNTTTTFRKWLLEKLLEV